ncbi:MAG: DUF6178 family protein, partial [Thermodesulfobacteriota bacterium]
MTQKNVSNLAEEKIKAVKKKKEEILKLEPEEALNEILDFRESLPLVHSFPEQSLYMLMHECGYEDFLPVLAMASKKQWEYIIDQEIWDRDEIDIHKASYWLGVFHMADPARLANWLLNDQDEFLTYFLRNKIDVVIREHDEDPSIIPDDFRTFDDVIYFKVFENEESQQLPVDITSLVYDLFSRIADESYSLFQTLIFTSAGVINAEHAENLYRLKNARLEEKGLLPLHEAIEVYAPVSPEDLPLRKEKVHDEQKSRFFVDENGNIDSWSIMDIFSAENYFTDFEFAAEFVSLCNKVIVADKKGVKTREDLSKVVKRVSGILKAGAQLIGGFHENDTNKALISNIFSKYYITDIFRAGHSAIRGVRDKILTWQRSSWMVKNSFNISFLGETWMGITGGLLVWPPVYYDNFETSDEIYRPFGCIDDIEKINSEVEKIIALDDLLGLINIKSIKVKDATLTWENFLLTLWARDWLHFDDTCLEPVKLEDFKKFFKWLWSEDDNKGLIGKDKKQDFLNWVVRTSEIDPDLMVKRLGTVFDQLFEAAESEFKDLDPKYLDPKYINIFLV